MAVASSRMIPLLGFLAIFGLVTTSLCLAQGKPAPAGDKPAKPESVMPYDQEPTPAEQQYTALPEADRLNLGPLGAAGRLNLKAKTITVTWVDPTGPCRKQLEVGDVISGVGDTEFKGDPRIELGNAIDAGEAKGQVALRLSRNGQVAGFNLPVARLGAMEEKYNPKDKKLNAILKRGCDFLVSWQDTNGRVGKQRSGVHYSAVVTATAALAMMAYDPKAYASNIKKAATYLSKIEEGSPEGMLETWTFSITATCLAEYILLTGDGAVMPGLRRCVGEIEKRQQKSGGWPHGLAARARTSYNELAAASIHAMIALSLAKRAKAPVDKDVLKKGYEYLEKCTNSGGRVEYFPVEKDMEDPKTSIGRTYGALVSAIIGGEDEAWRAKMAAYALTDQGQSFQCHASALWGVLMSATGARLSEAATGEPHYANFMTANRWYFTLARKHDGTFVGLPNDETVTKGQVNELFFDYKHAPLSATTFDLLALALGRGNITLGGKGIKAAAKPANSPASPAAPAKPGETKPAQPAAPRGQ